MRTESDLTLAQGRNVTTLSGIRKFAVVLPDGHQGYGFPIGGVAAIDPETGVISPGGIGFDINCGVRLLRTPLTYVDVEGREEELVERLYRTVPCGLGKGGYLETDVADLRGILEGGMEWMLEREHTTEADLEHCEENGRLPGNPKKVQTEALNRGQNQVGSLRSGNYFLEVQRIAEVHDEESAGAFGLEQGGVVVMVHSGSRGLLHQTCTEFIRRFEKASPDIADSLPDRQLIYAPLGEQAAEDYKAAMYAAANFAWANRQAMTEGVREVFEDLFDVSEVGLVYDVCHNVAKEERHRVNGSERTVLVHRKGATRAFPAGRPEVPEVVIDRRCRGFGPRRSNTKISVCQREQSMLDAPYPTEVAAASAIESTSVDNANDQHASGVEPRSVRLAGCVRRE